MSEQPDTDRFKAMVAIERSAFRQMPAFLILWIILALSVFAGQFLLVSQFVESMRDGADRPATLTESVIAFTLIAVAFISGWKIAAWIVSKCERPFAVRCNHCGESLSDFQRYDRVMRSGKCPSCSCAIVIQPETSPTVTMSKSDLLQALKLPIRLQTLVFFISFVVMMSVTCWIGFKLAESHLNTTTAEQRRTNFPYEMMLLGFTFFVPTILAILIAIKLATMVDRSLAVRCSCCDESLSAFTRYSRVCTSGKCWICGHPAYSHDEGVAEPFRPNVKLGRAIVSTSTFFAIAFSVLPNFRIEKLGMSTHLLSAVGWVLLLHFAPLWLYVGIRIRSLTDIVIAGVGVGVVAYWLNEAIHS